MNEPTMGALVRRLEAVERENRRFGDNVRGWIVIVILLLFAVPCIAAQPVKRSFENYKLGDHLGKVPPAWSYVPDSDLLDNENAFSVPSTSPGVDFVFLRYLDDKLYSITVSFTKRYVRRIGGPKAFLNKAKTKYGKPLTEGARSAFWLDGRTALTIYWGDTVMLVYKDKVLWYKREKRAKKPVPDF